MVRWQRMVVGAVAAGLLAVTVGAVPTEAGRRPDSVLIRGDVHDPQRLTAAQIEALPQLEVKVEYQSGSTTEKHTFTGALLFDVMALAEPGFDPNIKNDALAHVVTATGSDGYRATVAWGELDPNFEGKQILVATTEDGQALGAAGPRLVVPGDHRGGRYVSDVVTLKLVDA